jgi:hypothetical protein
MAMFSRRPPSLAHLSDEAASRALSKHYGDIVAAAKDLGVDRKDLRRLTWSNPAILAAAHERIDLFVITMRGELVSQAMHGSSRVRQCAIDRMYRVAAIPDHPIGKAFASLSLGLLARAPRGRSVVEAERVEVEKAAEAEEVRAALEQEAAAELELEREAEEARRRELAVEFETSRREERETVVARRSPAVGLSLTPAAQGRSLWPSGIRRPSRGGWR